MTLDEVRHHCLALPGAEVVEQWGDDQVYKIAGKMFAAHAATGYELSFKCSPEAFDMLVESGAGTPSRYLARAKWVTAKLDALPDEELAARLVQAYSIVRKGLTKKLQAQLPPFGG